EAYLFAIADAMRLEYEAVARAGLVLQVDCPDLGMGRHIQFADLDHAAFREMARLHVAALNHALANVPPEQARLHLCWGNYEGPHHHDIPLADIIDIAFTARTTAVSFEASNPRSSRPEKSLSPACSTRPPTSSSIRTWLQSASAGSRDWSAGRTSLPALTAALARGSVRPPSIRTSCGRSSRAWPKARGERHGDFGSRGAGECRGSCRPVTCDPCGAKCSTAREGPRLALP